MNKLYNIYMNENIYLDVEEYRENIVINNDILNITFTEDELKEIYEYKSVKQLKMIADYYGIKSRVKQDLIDNIILFELNDENDEIVLNRLKFWYYLNELKSNKFFSKYINL